MESQDESIFNEIKQADGRFAEIFSRGDAAGMAALYTEDGLLLPTGSDFVRGTRAIEEFWQGAMDAGVSQARLEPLEVEQHGDTAIEMGCYRLADAGGTVLDQGKYVVIWKRVEGIWKLRRDIWNTSQPAEA